MLLISTEPCGPAGGEAEEKGLEKGLWKGVMILFSVWLIFDRWLSVIVMCNSVCQRLSQPSCHQQLSLVCPNTVTWPSWSTPTQLEKGESPWLCQQRFNCCCVGSQSSRLNWSYLLYLKASGQHFLVLMQIKVLAALSNSKTPPSNLTPLIATK